MLRTVLRDERGSTLIELAISFMLLAIISLALVQSTLVAMNTNVISELRDEAVSVTEQRLNALRNTPFNASDTTTVSDMQVTDPLLPNGVTDPSVTKNVRGAARSFTIMRKVSQVGPDNRQVALTVTWNYRGVNYQNVVSTVLRGQ
jgi:Tfp pilus assembly protein PilV